MTDPEPLAVSSRAVRVAYDRRPILKSLDLDVERGEMVVLLGPSGSGKTTLLSALAGFITIEAGEIDIAGRRVADARRCEPPERRDVAVVFQSYALWPHLDALETVAYPLRRRGLGAVEAGREALAVLERLGIARLAHRRPAELSGGEQQRVGLGRALAKGAGLFLFDEPTAHLDEALREHLQAEIGVQRRQTGAAAIYATHDTTEALGLADRVVLLRDGEIVQQGAPADVYGCPVDAWAARLTGPASIIPVDVIEQSAERAQLDVAGSRHVVATASAATPGQEAAAGASRVPRRAQALIRPEWVRLGGDLPARIEAVAFRGTFTDYTTSTPAGPIMVRQLGSPVHALGEATGLGLDQAWLLDPESPGQAQ